MSAHILEANDFRLELNTEIFYDNLDCPVNAYLTVNVKNGDYSGSTLMDIDIDQLADFSVELKKVYDTLKGSAKIEEPYGHCGDITFTAEKNGYINISGHIRTETFNDVWKGNELNFRTTIDQTFFQPFVNGLICEFEKYSR